MKYEFLIREQAAKELEQVLEYLAKEHIGGGHKFLRELKDCFDSIRANPFGYQTRKDEYRHAFLRKWRYRVVYRVKGNRIYVVQIRHTSRRPSRRFGP